MLTEAVQVFPHMRDRLLEAAESLGELTWEQGLLCKGNSLCHGITGNGYLLHCLYRTFNNLGKQASNYVEDVTNEAVKR
jgi:hypothetical protein